MLAPKGQDRKESLPSTNLERMTGIEPALSAWESTDFARNMQGPRTTLSTPCLPSLMAR